MVVPNQDRSEIRKVSGQDLVPVLVDGGKVVYDSMEIVRYLEDRYPERPRLYPEDPARRAECLIFIDWFNRVWKRPPNEIAEELGKPAGQSNGERVDRLGAAMQGYLGLFEQMLADARLPDGGIRRRRHGCLPVPEIRRPPDSHRNLSLSPGLEGLSKGGRDASAAGRMDPPSRPAAARLKPEDSEVRA